MLTQAAVTTAQLNAVWEGRKPAFLETDPELVRPFAQELPPGLHYVEVGHSACIYHAEATARDLGIPEGKELHEAVRQAVESGDCGLLLGYGAPSIYTRPSHGVSIMRNGEVFYRFNSSADAAKAEHYARERMRDFSDAFPKDRWDWDINKRPATATLHAAANPLRHEEYVPALTPDATYRTSQEWAELAPEMRAGKFFLACVEDERLLLAMHKLVDDCMQAGVSEDEFIHRAFLMLGEIEDPLTGKPYYDPARRMAEMSYEERIAYDNSTSHIDARARLKLIFRTQSELAAGYAQWQKALEPDNLRRFPAWRFVRQPGARIKRPDHVEHENEVRLISDTEYWLARNSPDQGGFNNPFPPFGYNSWMRVERVSRKEAVKLGLLAKEEEPTPPPEADRWSLRQAVEQANTASLDTLPPESVERIKERCREAGITLTPAASGGYTAKPAPGAVPHLPFTDNLEEELNELMRLLGEFDPPPASAAPTLPWLSTLFGKLLPPTDPGDTYASNPYGCNQHGHKPGCPHAGGVPGYKAEGSGAEARRLATAALRSVVGKKLRNLRFGIEATISGNSLKKIVSGNALGTSFRNLVDVGFCDKDTAFRIHMVAVANLPELFANAPTKEDQAVYHEHASRETATHLYSPFNVEGYDRPFIADISVIGYKGVGDMRVYSIGVRVWPPLPTSGASQEKLRVQSEGGGHRSHVDIKTQRTEPVKPQYIHAANPYGCNQHRHAPGCPHAGGGVDPDLKQNLDAALRRARREDGTVEQGGELNRTHEVRLREMPDVMKALGEPDVPLVMTVYHIRKVSNGHKLSVSKIEDAVKSLGNPVLTVLEADGSYLHLLDTESLNSENVMAPLVGVVRKKSNREDARFVVSFYPLDEDKESKFTQQFKRLVYCRQNKTAKFTADAPASNKASELLRAAIDGGFAGSVLTWEDIVKPKKRPGPDSIHAAANPYGCNQHRHKPGCPQKGTTREPQTKGTPRRVHKVDQTQPIHKQISALADALERAARDGTRLEAVIYRSEFGELTLDCGNPGKSTDPIGKGGHGVQHALEERHHVSERDIAHTLLTGKVTIQTDHPSRLRVETEQFRVVLERELINNSGRISNTRATLHTAMKRP